AAAADPVAAPAASAAAAPAASAAPAAAPAPAALPLAEATSASASADTYFSRLRYLGQLDLTYLVCEGDGELVLIDQHAAHERVAFERLVAGHGQRAAPRQRLLLPQILDVDPRLSAVADEARDLLEASGFEVEPFGEASGGGTSLALRAVPSELRKGADPAALLRELLAELAEEGGSRAADERLRAVLATIACHSVVRAGDRMSPAEACSLLESLDRTPRRTHCPHGRPVMQRLAVDELARRFGR
ncbi:MAG TPA: hypothetical protein VKZ63_17660, partial [Kofleriaceae bacterium]|nr:hypothetical protein [Kofleriaceae bacterium]